MLVIVGWCVLSLLAAIAVVVDSFLPGAPHVPPNLVLAMPVAVAPAAVAIIAVAPHRRVTGFRAALPWGAKSRPTLLPLVRVLPRLPRVVATALMFGGPAFAFALLALASVHGLPRVVTDGYARETVSGLIPIDRTEYLRLQALQERWLGLLMAGAHLELAALTVGARILRRAGFRSGTLIEPSTPRR